MQSNKTFTLEGARIVYRNFGGREGKYNREGDRSFVLELPVELAETLEAEGWNVRYPTPRDEDEHPFPRIAVSVAFDRRPPRVVLVRGERKVVLEEADVEMLDWADLEAVDLVVRGYDWSRGDDSGTKAYLQTLYAVVADDDIRRKYGDVL